MLKFMRMLIVFTFMLVLPCSAVWADESLGFDFSKEQDEEEARARREKEGQIGQAEDQQASRYLHSLKNLIAFAPLIKREGFNIPAADKMAQQNVYLGDLLDSVSKRAIKRAEYTGQKRPLIVDDRFQLIQQRYMQSISTTINFMRINATSYSRLKTNIAVYNGKIGKIDQDLQDVDNLLLFLVLTENWNEGIVNLLKECAAGFKCQEFQDVFSFGHEAFIRSGADSISEKFVSENENYIKKGQFGAKITGKITVVDSFMDSLKKEKEESAGLDTRFKDILEHWNNFSTWLEEQAKLLPVGVWKEAANNIGTSAREIHKCLAEYYEDYQNCYKDVYVSGDLSHLANRKKSRKEHFREFWNDELKKSLSKEFERYKKELREVKDRRLL